MSQNTDDVLIPSTRHLLGQTAPEEKKTFIRMYPTEEDEYGENQVSLAKLSNDLVQWCSVGFRAEQGTYV